MSLGSITLVVMAMLVKQVGSHIPTIEILFFRSFIGFFFVLPMFIRNPMEPLRTKRLGMHVVRGMIGTLGNISFFWTLTHMLLADAMALQFSRPLFMMPLALLFLGEIAGWRRTAITIVGLRRHRALRAAVHGGLRSGRFRRRRLVRSSGALVVICIKRLSKTEPTRTIMFYYAISNALFSLIPTIWLWVTPDWFELTLLVLIGLLGISGQGLITHGWTLGDVDGADPARLLAHRLFGGAGLPGVRRIAGAVELRRHGDHRGKLALSGADRAQARLPQRA